MAISLINHDELLYLLEMVENPESLLDYMPRWMTIERLYSLLNDYRAGHLTDLEIAELEAVLDIVPALVEMWEQGELR